MIAPFERLRDASSRLHLAAPYFTEPTPLLEAARAGKTVQLLVGLNEATSPQALREIHEVPNIAIRYFTSRFHAKIYVFDQAALLGSANLTDGGLRANREAVICLDQEEDAEAIDEIRALFVGLWKAGQVLTREKLGMFERARRELGRRNHDAENPYEALIGQAQPPNINVDANDHPRERVFLERLRQQVYEQYRPAFNEVAAIFRERGYQRPELANVGVEHMAASFLSFVRLTYAGGDDAWREARRRSVEERHQLITGFAENWTTTDAPKLADDYISRLQTVQRTFGTREAIEAADRDRVTDGLMALHAFYDQLRFVKGGSHNLPPVFWEANGGDLTRIKASLTYLLHGPGDFVERLHDFLYDPGWKLRRFGLFCALELYGTAKPQECPAMNGRTAKALRFLGFDVVGA